MKLIHILSALLLSASAANAQQLEQQLFPGDPESFCDFGNAMDIDGDVAIIGASEKNENGFNYAGAAYIFRRTPTGWVQEAKLMATAPEIHDNFGTSVDIEGDVAVVGAPDFPYSSFTGTGRVWIFRRIAGVWTLEQEVIPSNGSIDDGCGRFIALSGNTLAVSNGGNDTISMFEYAAGTWTETTTLSTPPTAYIFPTALALQGDRLAAGSSWETVNGLLRAGVVRIFERNGSAWQLAQVITDPIPNDEDYFGTSIAMDQGVLAVGIPEDNFENFSYAGMVQVFRHNGSSFQFEAELHPSLPMTYGNFGSEVAVSGDRILSSSTRDSVGGFNFGGAAYAYQWNGIEWIGGAAFLPQPFSGQTGYGYNVAIDGDTAFVSNWQDAFGYAAVGSAFTWDLSSGFRLQSNPTMPEADNDATWLVSGGSPNAPAWLAYSLAGLGSVYFAPLNVTLGIANPQQAGNSIQLNASGNGQWSLYLPPAAQNLTVYFQTVQMGGASNVLSSFIR